MERLTTKEVIGETLKELLLTKPLSKITVNEIASTCHINRQTFYYHFVDIPDLVEWVVLNEADKEIKKNKEYKTWEEAFLAVFELIIKDKPFIENIYHSVSKDILTKYLYKLVYPTIYKVVDILSKDYHCNEDDKVFIANFYKDAFVALVIEFVDKDMKDDPKIIIDKLSRLLDGTIEHSIKSYTKS